MNVLSSVYGAAATWRRRWYARDPSRTQHLERPVISVGNLRVGGSGKTPVVATLVERLLATGERPCILSRGYARTRPSEGVTVVADSERVRANFASAGDEPLMLARRLPGVPVLVGADRFASGQYAERTFGVSVHVLDDGFQHVRLARDIDLLLVDEADLGDRVLPRGRLREPLANAAAAHAVLVSAADAGSVATVAATLGIATAFHVTRSIQAPRTLTGNPMTLDGSPIAVAFAGIARPERFFADLAARGWALAARKSFADHHPYTQADIDQLVETGRRSGASLLVTTEKDAARLADLDACGLTIAVIPLSVAVEPARAFDSWLSERIAAARAGRS